MLNTYRRESFALVMYNVKKRGYQEPAQPVVRRDISSYSPPAAQNLRLLYQYPTCHDRRAQANVALPSSSLRSSQDVIFPTPLLLSHLLLLLRLLPLYFLR